MTSQMSLRTSLQIVAAISSVFSSVGAPPPNQPHQSQPEDQPPHFLDESTEINNITAQLGVTTYVNCRVNNLGGKTVSWLKRHSDTTPHLLTFGRTTYSHDERFQIIHDNQSDWKLQIQFPRLADQGIYECMVSTNPPIVRKTRLTVIAPEIEVVDDRHRAVAEKFYKLGSTIELMCSVRRIVGREPEYVLWHHEHKMLNYDAERGGISVKTDLRQDGAVSQLFISDARKSDSGNYTCSMRNAQTSVFVHILDGENPAAMHTSSAPPILTTSRCFVMTGMMAILGAWTTRIC